MLEAAAANEVRRPMWMVVAVVRRCRGHARQGGEHQPEDGRGGAARPEWDAGHANNERTTPCRRYIPD